jgi:hypothetical protein
MVERINVHSKGLLSIEGKATYCFKRLFSNTGYYILGIFPISINEL